MSISTMLPKAAKHQKSGVHSLYTFQQVREDIRALYRAKNSFRRIAKEDFGNQISHATIQRIYNGHEPKHAGSRLVLGLPQTSLVNPISGEIPAGTQVLNAVQCSCGQWFVTNHPRRSKCFLCSPYKGKKRA